MDRKLIFLLFVVAAFAYTCTPRYIDVVSFVKKHEGSRSCVYKDSRGIPTIGVGFNLRRPDARALISSVGADYDKVLSGKQCLKQWQIDTLLRGDLDTAESCARTLISNWSSQPQPVQAVLIDMTFNLGCYGVKKFRNMRRAFEAFNFQRAAREMQSSRWCRQVKSRCTENCRIIRSCH